MSRTIIELKKDARKKLHNGVKVLAETVKVTLGPAGRLVLIDRGDFQPHLTKDGVTVAKHVHLTDVVENLGAQMIRQAADKVVAQAGDGTTSVTTLAAELIDRGMLAVELGYNPVLLKKGMLKASEDAIELLEGLAEPIKEEDLKNVATISANGDESIGEVISSAISEVGADGVVVIEESRDGNTKYEMVEGLEFDRGYKSPFFITDEGKGTVNLKDADILLINARLMDLTPQLEAVLNRAITENRALVIVAEDFDDKILSILIVNKSRGALRVAAVKAPGFGEDRIHLMNDIAAITGATVIDKITGHTMEAFPTDMSWLGFASKVAISRDSTVIVDGAGNEDAIEERVKNIKEKIDVVESNYDREKLQDRLAKLIGGVAVIQVGGINETAMLERKDRFEDALFATRAAMDEGIVPGGGTTALELKRCLEDKVLANKDENYGYHIVTESLSIFIKTILQNAGYTEEQIITNIMELRSVFTRDEFVWPGIDVNTNTIIDYKEAGVIDPAKVVRAVIQTACEIASNILLVEGVIATEAVKEEAQLGF